MLDLMTSSPERLMIAVLSMMVDMLWSLMLTPTHCMRMLMTSTDTAATIHPMIDRQMILFLNLKICNVS